MTTVTLQCPVCDRTRNVLEEQLDPEGDWPRCWADQTVMLPIRYGRPVLHHLNGDPNDNRIENLRIADPRQNRP